MEPNKFKLDVHNKYWLGGIAIVLAIAGPLAFVASFGPLHSRKGNVTTMSDVIIYGTIALALILFFWFRAHRSYYEITGNELIISRLIFKKRIPFTSIARIKKVEGLDSLKIIRKSEKSLYIVPKRLNEFMDMIQSKIG